MSRLDQRVRSVELRAVNLLTSDQVASVVDPGATPSSPDTTVSSSAPYQFRKVQDAYIYPKAVGYSTDRVEIYTEADLGAGVGDRLEVSGIHWASSSPIDVDGDNFTVLEVDTPPWDGRTLPNGVTKHDPEDDQLTGVEISNTYTFKPDTSAPTTWSSVRRLQTRRKVNFYEISAAPSTVTLTMNAVHHFEVGDVIFVDIFAKNSTAYGQDGLFRITAVTSTTIEYELSAGVDTAVLPTDISGDEVYVFPVAREYRPYGSTWVDSANNETYYWDGIRWVSYTPGAVTEDGDPPSPVTGFSATSTAEVAPVTYEAYAKVTLSWTAPTTSVSGNSLTDLVGYKIRWRRTTTEDWLPWISFLDATATSYVFDSETKLSQGQLYYFQIVAIDSGLQESTSVTTSHTTVISAGDHTVYPPNTPTATSRLGTITIAWDGNLRTGVSTVTAPDNIVSMNVYMSTISGFTPNSSNLYERVSVFGGGGAFTVITDLTYGTTYYFKITLTDSAGVESSPSIQVAAQVQPLVDTDLIANTLNTWPFAGQVIPVGALADGSINASTLFGDNVVVQDAIAANAIGVNELAANSVIAGKIGANAVTAGTIAALTIQAGQIAANAIESDKITAGAITAVKINTDAVEAGKIKAGAVEADKIKAGAVTASKLESEMVLSSDIIVRDASNGPRIEIRGSTNLGPRGIVAFKNSGSGVANAAFRFYTDGTVYLDDVSIDTGGIIRAGATTFENGAITGGVIRTSASTSQERIRLDGPNVWLSFCASGDSNGDPQGTIQSRGTQGIRIQAKSNVMFTIGAANSGVDANNKVFINSSGMGFVAPTTQRWQGSLVTSATGGLSANGGNPSPGEILASANIEAGTFITAGTYINANQGIKANADSATGYIELTSSGTIVRKAVDTNTSSYNYAIWNRFTGALDIGLSTSSDVRMKKNIVDTSLGLDFINDVRPVEFEYIEPGSKFDEGVQFGIIAQELKTTLESYNIPDNNGLLNTFDDTDYYSLTKDQLIAPLIKAVQELSQKNIELESRIASLEGE